MIVVEVLVVVELPDICMENIFQTHAWVQICTSHEKGILFGHFLHFFFKNIFFAVLRSDGGLVFEDIEVGEVILLVLLDGVDYRVIVDTVHLVVEAEACRGD